MDFAQIAASIIVGAVSAWIAGSLGVHHGLKRAQREKAFDRRLDWYEKTIRAFDGFKINLKSMIQTPALSDKFAGAVESITKSAEEVRGCVGGATVYAKRRTLLQM